MKILKNIATAFLAIAPQAYAGCAEDCRWAYNVCTGSAFNEGSRINPALVSKFVQMRVDQSVEGKRPYPAGIPWTVKTGPGGFLQLERTIDGKSEVIVFDHSNAERCAKEYEACMKRCKK